MTDTIHKAPDDLKTLMKSALADYEAYGVGGSEGARAMRQGLARIEELEAQIAAMEEGLTAVHMAGYMDGKKAAEAKLAQQDDLVQAANRLAEYLNGDHIYMERVHYLAAAIREGGE